MYSVVKITTNNQKIIIQITQNKTIIYKIALWIIILMITALLIIAPFAIIKNEKDIITIFGTIGISLFLLIFIFKHLKIVYGKETLTIQKKKIEYENTMLGLGKYFEIESNQIKKIRYVGYEDNVKHDLEIEGDVLGFGTGQGEIAYLNQEGTILIQNESANMRFGLNVSNEDAIEIITKIKCYLKK